MDWAMCSPAFLTAKVRVVEMDEIVAFKNYIIIHNRDSKKRLYPICSPAFNLTHSPISIKPVKRCEKEFIEFRDTTPNLSLIFYSPYHWALKKQRHGSDKSPRAAGVIWKVKNKMAFG